jgi:hypothetical protein
MNSRFWTVLHTRASATRILSSETDLWIYLRPTEYAKLVGKDVSKLSNKKRVHLMLQGPWDWEDEFLQFAMGLGAIPSIRKERRKDG